jgi:hypothetical protein
MVGCQQYRPPQLKDLRLVDQNLPAIDLDSHPSIYFQDGIHHRLKIQTIVDSW